MRLCFDSLLVDAQNAGDVKDVIKVAGEIGAKDKENLASVFTNVDQADELKEVVTVATEVGAKDKENLGSVLQNADKATDLRDVVDVADEIGAKDKENLTSVFKNADQASNLKTVVDEAEGMGAKDKENLAGDNGVFKNAQNSESIVNVINYSGRDDVGLKDKNNLAGESGVFQNANQADKLDRNLYIADELGILNKENMSGEGGAFQNADKALAANDVLETAAKRFNLFDEDGRRSSHGEADQEDVDTMAAIFRTSDKSNEVAAVVNNAREGEGDKLDGVFKVVKGVDKAKQDSKAAEEAAQQAAIDAALAQAALDQELSSASAEEKARILAKKAALDDYSSKLDEINAATDSSTVDTLLSQFESAHDSDIKGLLIADGLDLSSKASARRTSIKSEKSAAQKENVFGNLETVTELAVASIQVEKQAAAEADAAQDAVDAAETALEAAKAAGDADAIAKAEAKKAKAEKAKANAEAKATDTGFESMIENADQANELKKMVDKNAEIEEAAKKAKEDADKALEVAQASGDTAAIEAAQKAQEEAAAATENKADLGSLLKKCRQSKRSGQGGRKG